LPNKDLPTNPSQGFKKSIAMSVLDANRLARRPQQQRRQLTGMPPVDTRPEDSLDHQFEFLSAR